MIQIMSVIMIYTCQITCLISIRGLSTLHVSKLNYMNNAIEHARDALEFCCHDLKHVQHFCSSTEDYKQQVSLLSFKLSKI